MRVLSGLSAAFLIVLTLLSAGCATNPATGHTELVLMSEAQELALGRKMHPEVIKEYGRYPDEVLQDYVQQVGERVASHSDRPELIYRFTVLDSPLVNAFALPGGYIYITRGLLAYLGSEAQLAGVLGHEIGHVAARHSVRQYSQRMIIGILGSVAASAAGVRGATDLLRVLGTVIERGYGRKMELEADRLGARYLARSGYPPEAMLEVLRLLKAQEEYELQAAREEGREPHVYHGLFATHPDADTRLKEVIAAARALQVSTGAAVVRREPYLQHLEGLVFGEDEKDGILRRSGFYHGPLGFVLRFPRGWVVENEPERLVARTRDGKARLVLLVQDLNRHTTPEEFVRRRLRARGLRPGRSLEIDALPAYIAPYAEGQLGVIFLNRRAFIFVGRVEPGAPADADERILHSIESFHRLRPRERRLAQALRIHLLRARAGDTIERLAARSPLPLHAAAQLRLLNGLYPDGEPHAGTLIKTVR